MTKSKSHLGFVASGRRSIGSGAEYNKFFDMSVLQGTDPVINTDGTNYDTLREMERIAQNCKSQTRKIARHLKASSTEATLRNIWKFLYGNVQYKKDSPTQEQLRTPLRTWKDRKTGVDCDCYSIFISACLRTLGISHAFRMAGYSGDFQHVYVVVPKDGRRQSLENGNYYTVDPVVDQFNYEVPFKKKFDRYMNIQSLNGLGDVPAQTCETPQKYNNNNEDMIRVSYLESQGYVVTEKLLNENNIPFQEYSFPNGSVRYSAGDLHSIEPVLTQQEAADLIKTLQSPSSAPGTPGSTSQPPKKKSNSALLWIAGISGALLLFSGSNRNSPAPALSGVPVKKAAKKKKKGKRKTVYI